MLEEGLLVRRVVAGGLAATLSCLLSIAATSSDTDSHLPRLADRAKPTVFVLAVKEARLLTMCVDIPEVRFADGGSWTPNGRARAVVGRDGDDIQEVVVLAQGAGQGAPVDDPDVWARRSVVAVALPKPARPDEAAQPGFLLERAELDRGRAVIDQPVQDSIAKEFARLKRYEVVESAATADYVFLAETSYTAEAAASKGSNTYVQRGDWPQNLRQSVLAIMVPGAAYRRTPGDINALLQDRMWEGSDLMQRPYRLEWENWISEARYVEEKKTYGPASPEWVVQQLHGRVRRMPGHPVLCSASTEPFRVETAATTAFPEPPPRASAPDTAPAPSLADQRPPATFRSAITYVPVHVSVADAAGGDLRDVAASEFRVYEDDLEQTIDRVLSLSQPFNMVLLVDGSTSMRSNVARIQEAVLGFVDGVRQDDQLMLVSFHRRVLQQAPLTKDRARTRQAVYQIDKRDGTRLYDAIRLSAERLPPASAERRAIVLVTDGVDTQSRFADAAATLAWAAEADIAIYVVEYEASDNDVTVRVVTPGTPLIEPKIPPDTLAHARQFLQELAASTGGQIYRATTLDGLADALGRVAHDLSVLYTVCYYPSNQALDGTYRRLRIEVTRSGAKTRARPGYRAESGKQ